MSFSQSVFLLVSAGGAVRQPDAAVLDVQLAAAQVGS